MDRQAFLRAVKDAGRNIPAEHLDKALQYFMENFSQFSPSYVRSCVQFAGMLVEASTTRPSKQDGPVSAEDAERLISMTTQEFIATKLREIQGWVVNARMALTGSTQPLCHTLEEVIFRCLELDRASRLPILDDWLGWSKPPPEDDGQEEFDAWLSGLPEKPQRAKKPAVKKPKRPPLWIDMGEEEEARDHQMALLDDLLTQVHQRSAVKYFGNWLRYGQSPLVYLANETRELELATGLRQTDLIVYVLAGIEPSSLPDHVWSHPLSRAVNHFGLKPRRKVNMTIHEAVESEEEFRTKYKRVRQAQGLHNRVGLPEEDYRYWKLVNDRKGPWQWTGSAAKWTAVNEESKRMEGKHFQEWRGAHKGYRDINKRIKRLSQ